MFQKINKNSAEVILADPHSILVDIRDRESYDAGHVEGALYLSQEGISAFISDTEKSVPILVMCYHGNSSQSVAHYLSLQGFSEVYSVDGGYEGWINS